MSNLQFTNVSFEDQLLFNAYPGLEGKLRKWAKPPSKTEKEKCERTEKMIREAINQDPVLKNKKISVFAKGSYANRTNIPSDSDVDIAIQLNDLFINTYPEGTSRSDFDFVSADYSYEDFKKDVFTAVKRKFPDGSVSYGSKSIIVESSTARIDADVVIFAVHRRFYKNKEYSEGTALRTKNSTIYNWPEQNYLNGVNKNSLTNKRYKPLVRILKNVRSLLKKSGYPSADNASSFLLESIAWNIPNFLYIEDSYKKMTYDCLDYLINEITDYNKVKDWVEVNDLKYLFRSSQKWTREQTLKFLKDAKSYLEPIN
jgi:hypothetical protein